MPFAKEKMGFSRPPKLFLRQNTQNAADPMGKTGFYDPENEAITLYVTGRHPKDVMRSLAHELQHHTQKCNGDFENVQNMGEQGYAQADPHMRSMEIQAYQASIVFRDWEDSIKETIYYEHLQKGDKSSMSTKKWKNRELNGLLMERFGFDFKPLVESLDGELEENFQQPGSATGAGPSNKAGKMDRTDVANKATGRWLKEEEELDLNEEELEEGGRANRRENEPEGEERRMKQKDRVREAVRKLKEHGFTTEQIKESLTDAYKKAQKR